MIAKLLSNATQKKLPTTVPNITYSSTLVYTLDLNAVGKQAARLANQVLRGTAQVGNIPVEVAENFLTLNLVNAKAINLEVPEVLLLQAHKLIRETE
jgi:ABC-type uncharacterized transport system substrate-binding protein